MSYYHFDFIFIKEVFLSEFGPFLLFSLSLSLLGELTDLFRAAAAAGLKRPLREKEKRERARRLYKYIDFRANPHMRRLFTLLGGL